MLEKHGVLKKLEYLSEEAGLTDKQVIKEASILATSDITDFLSVDEIEDRITLNIKPSKKWHKDRRRAIKSIKKTKYGFELTLHGKDAQLTNLFKHFGLFQEADSEKEVGGKLIEVLKENIDSTWSGEDEK